MSQLSLFKVLPQHSRGRTILDAQMDMDARQDRGTSCPCCGATVKVYRRSIHGQMAAWLVDLCRASPTGYEAGASDRPLLSLNHPRLRWVDIRRLPARGGDYAKLRFWRLVEHQDPGSDSGRSGLWRPTELGWRFARGQTTVPKFARVYRGQCLGFSGGRVSVRDCLGTRFNFYELWAGGD